MMKKILHSALPRAIPFLLYNKNHIAPSIMQYFYNTVMTQGRIMWLNVMQLFNFRMISG